MIPKRAWVRVWRNPQTGKQTKTAENRVVFELFDPANSVPGSSGACYRFRRGEAIRLAWSLTICALGMGRDNFGRMPFARCPMDSKTVRRVTSKPPSTPTVGPSE